MFTRKRMYYINKNKCIEIKGFNSVYNISKGLMNTAIMLMMCKGISCSKLQASLLLSLLQYMWKQ